MDRKRSLRRRVFIGILLTTVSALLIAGATMVIYNLKNYSDNIVRDTTGNAQLIGFASIPALQFDDRQLATRTLELLRTQPDVIAAAIYNSQGRLFAEYQRDNTGPDLPGLPGNTGHEIVRDRLELFYRIDVNDEILGTVYLRTHYRRAELLLTQAKVMAATIAVALLISMLLSYWAQTRLTGPVLDIARLAQRIAAERDYSLRARKTTQDEIGELADSFNDLVAEVDRSKEEMRISNEALHREVVERQQAEEEIQRLNSQLEARVEERTAELENANRELEAFSYSVSHDLRSPLRAIDGFSQALLEDYAGKLDDTGRDYLKRVRAAAQRMGQLIDDLLKLSRINRAEFRPQAVDLSAMAREVADALQTDAPQRDAQIRITSGLQDMGDPHLMRIALENLLGNAWKYTSKNERTEIEFGMRNNKGTVSYFVQDNGAGFDMNYADKLFGAFQRMHDAREYPGTGIGLATVQRIIHRHGGHIWAQAEPGKGATFYFTLKARRAADETQTDSAG